MPCDRYRTPALSRRQRAYDALCVLVLVMVLAAIVAAATFVVALLS